VAVDEERLRVLSGVAVCGVAVDGDDVYVGIYGGSTMACLSVCFTYDDESARDTDVAALLAWDRAGTTLTLVSGDGMVSLTDDRRLVERAGR
jgi:hypothetical protein